MDIIDIFHLTGAFFTVAVVVFIVRLIARLRRLNREARENFDRFVASRKEHEQELRTKEEEFRLLAMTLPIGIFKLNLSNELTYVNTRFLEILGIPLEENFEMNWIDFVVAEDREPLIRTLDESRLKFHEVQNEFRVRGADGRTRWVELRLSTAISDDEIHFIGVLEDIGRRKRMEAELLSLRETSRPADERPETEGMTSEASDGSLGAEREERLPPPAVPGDARILLVEDNLVNQKVAAKMLLKLGFACDIAYHGAEAVEACGKKRYDLVLMDCQMPILDGFEATRRIRALGEGFETMPIVAMTANVMRGDRERCIAAGMNEYLSKPVTLDALREVLARNGLTKDLPKTASADAFPALDPAALQRSSENDRRFEEEMLTLFLSDTGKRLDILRRLTGEAKDLPAIRIEAHTIKGSCGNIGAKAMQEAAYKLEIQAAEGRAEGLAELFDRLAAQFPRLEAAIGKYRRTTLAGLNR